MEVLAEALEPAGRIDDAVPLCGLRAQAAVAEPGGAGEGGLGELDGQDHVLADGGGRVLPAGVAVDWGIARGHDIWYLVRAEDGLLCYSKPDINTNTNVGIKVHARVKAGAGALAVVLRLLALDKVVELLALQPLVRGDGVGALARVRLADGRPVLLG